MYESIESLNSIITQNVNKTQNAMLSITDSIPKGLSLLIYVLCFSVNLFLLIDIKNIIVTIKWR